MKESPVHLYAVQLLQFAGVPGLIYYHCPNEGRRAARTGAFQKRLGMLPGVADLSLVLPGGKACFLELKRRGGALSPAQRAFRALCEKNGTPYAVATTTAEVETILREWGAIRTIAPAGMKKAA